MKETGERNGWWDRQMKITSRDISTRLNVNNVCRWVAMATVKSVSRCVMFRRRESWQLSCWKWSGFPFSRPASIQVGHLLLTGTESGPTCCLSIEMNNNSCEW